MYSFDRPGLTVICSNKGQKSLIAILSIIQGYIYINTGGNDSGEVDKADDLRIKDRFGIVGLHSPYPTFLFTSASEQLGRE